MPADLNAVSSQRPIDGLSYVRGPMDEPLLDLTIGVFRRANLTP